MRKIIAGAVFGATVFAAGAAQAGPNTEKLRECVLKSTDARDQVRLIPWLLDSIGAHSKVAGKFNSTFTFEEHKASSAAAAGMFQRAILTNCRAETIKAVKSDGEAAISAVYGALFEMGFSQLMTSQVVWDTAQGKIAAFVDGAKLDALAKEAGVK